MAEPAIHGGVLCQTNRGSLRVQRKGGRRRGATEGLAEGGRRRWFAGAAGREEERPGAVAPLLVELLDDGAAGAWERGRAGRSWWVLEREEGSMEKGGCVREREIEGVGIRMRAREMAAALGIER